MVDKAVSSLVLSETQYQHRSLGEGLERKGCVVKAPSNKGLNGVSTYVSYGY